MYKSLELKHRVMIIIRIEWFYLTGTNDKAGSPYYILKFANLQSVKTQTEPTNDWSYPYMRISPKKV